MTYPLDDPSMISKYDKEDMLTVIAGFCSDTRKAIRDSEEVELGALKRKQFKALLIVGMGGSAIGGTLLKDWLLDSCKIPIVVSRGYHLPAWVDKDTLVYVVSYSGNTEETLSQFREAVDRGSQVVSFFSGGQLSRITAQMGIPAVKYSKGYQTRAAIAVLFFSLATISRRLGFVCDEKWAEVDEALVVLKHLSEEMTADVPTDVNLGKSLAMRIKGYIPFVYGSRLYEGVAYRYSTQFNENSKTPAASSFLPEAFHNSIMASEADTKFLEKICVIIIRDPHDEKALVKKVDKLTELISDRFGRVVEVETKGEGRLARMLSALYIGDYASVYLGILYGHDPSLIDSIELLKNS